MFEMAKKVQTFETYVCDVCGKIADGEYNSTTYVNGEVTAEMYCPHDLCRSHMGKWSCLCEDQAFERYDGSPSEDKKQEMLVEFQRLMG
jgi:hypothetical protein